MFSEGFKETSGVALAGLEASLPLPVVEAHLENDLLQ
jgi:hypothetical protein